MSLSEEEFAQRLKKLGVEVSELEERFARASGPGGQHVNKVSTAVTLLHRGLDFSVTVQDSRSQATNRALARERFLEALEARLAETRASERAAKEKIRRRNRPRPFGVKQKILKGKKLRSGVKKLRGRVSDG